MLHASIFYEFIKRLKLGTDVSYTYGLIDINYETSSSIPLDPNLCEQKNDVYVCTQGLAELTNFRPTLFFDTLFTDKTGLFYFEGGGSFALRKYSSVEKTFDSDEDLSPPGYLSPPLKHVKINLYGLITRAYLEFGFTPKYFPDVILDIGGDFNF